MADSNKPLVVGLAGFGTVGGGLARLLEENAGIIRQRTGRDIQVKKVLVRNAQKARTVPLPPGADLTTNPDELINDPEIDVLVELMGGIDAPRTIIDRALDAGKHIVTANKALLAEEGLALFQKAAGKGRILRYEASVAGAVPVVEALRTSLAGNRISSLMGILNGTSNYILSEMTSNGLDFDVALKQAPAAGLCRSRSHLDIDGHDAAHKLTLLIRLAYGVNYPYTAMPVRGIRGMSSLDIALAREFGYRISSSPRCANAASPASPTTRCGWRRACSRPWCPIRCCWPAWAACTTPFASAAMPAARSSSTARRATCPPPVPCWPTSWPWPVTRTRTTPATPVTTCPAPASCRPRNGVRATMCASWSRRARRAARSGRLHGRPGREHGPGHPAYRRRQGRAAGLHDP